MSGSRRRRPSHLSRAHISPRKPTGMFQVSERGHTAEGRVENDVMIIEVLVNRAPGSAHERSGRRPPAGWIGGCGERIGRDVAPGEIEDVDGVARPFEGIDSSAVAVESVAKGSRSAVLDAAAP